jgi:hypothetical protein
MTNRVNTAMNAVEATGGDAVRDAARTNTSSEKLPG